MYLPEALWGKTAGVRWAVLMTFTVTVRLSLFLLLRRTWEDFRQAEWKSSTLSETASAVNKCNLSQSDGIPTCDSLRMGISNPATCCAAGTAVWMGFSGWTILSHGISTMDSLRLQGLWLQTTEVTEPLKQHQRNKRSGLKTQPLPLLWRNQLLKMTSKSHGRMQWTTEVFPSNLVYGASLGVSQSSLPGM